MVLAAHHNSFVASLWHQSGQTKSLSQPFRQADACRGIQMTNKYQPGLKFGWRVETQEAHVGIYCKEQSGCNFVYSWQSPREGYDLYFVLANTFCVKILFMGVH